MKTIPAGLAGASVLLGASLLAAQAPDTNRMFAHPTYVIAPGPQNPSQPEGYSPIQMKAAYGFNRIPNLGQGQTIALVDANDDPNIESDLAFYASYFHLTPCNFQKVIVGNPQGDSDWGLEMSLDVEQACAMAPQANIVLVEANSALLTDLLAAVQAAYMPPVNATVISMSWGYPEFSYEYLFDSYFCNILNGNGDPVTFVAASGDTGHFAPIYPGTSHCVISVGGTTMTLSTPIPLSSPLQLDYGPETAWGPGVNSTGGGVSPYEPQQSWQNPACATWSTTNRCMPDVASDGDPNTGVPVYDTYDYSGWMKLGGTSLAAPDWGSFFTLVNSLRASQGKALLSQAAPDLYTIYYSSNYLTDFHDITSGSNGECGSECEAGPGYDLLTGIGTYQANNLYLALVADPN